MLLPFRERKYFRPVPGVTLRSPQAINFVAFSDRKLCVLDQSYLVRRQVVELVDGGVDRVFEHRALV